MKRKLITLLLALMVTFGVSAQNGLFHAQKNVNFNDKVKSEKNIVVKNLLTSGKFENSPSKGEISIGTGTLTTERYPIYAYFGYSYTQSLYMKSEVSNVPIIITKIAYYFNGTSLSKSNDWKIFIGHSTKSLFTGLSDYEPITNLTEVYSGIFTSPTGPGWIEFDVTDFLYNGIDNLVIACDENAVGYNASADRFYCSAVTGNRSLNWYSDTQNPDPASPGAAAYNHSVIPNIKITYIPAAGADYNFIVKNGATPLKDVKINVNTVDYTTNASGSASIYLPEGMQHFTFSKFGYNTVNDSSLVVDNVDSTFNVAMTALPTFNVTFNVKNKATVPANIDGAIVIAYSNTVEIARDTTVAGAAVFTIPSGSYTYDVIASGYASKLAVPVAITADITIPVSLDETMVTPYGPLAKVTGKNCNFSWNNSMGWNEGFETSFPPAGWSVVNTNTVQNWKKVGTVTFTSGDVVPQEGTSQAEIMWAESAQNEWLKTNSFTVPPSGFLKFWSYSGAKASTHGDHYYVKISTDGGTTWTPIWDAVTNNISATAAYEQHNVNLSTYAGQNVMLAWQAVDGDGQGLWFSWFIDKIQVGSTTKSTKALESYTVYLDNVQVAANVNTTSYDFTAVASGIHNAGVKAIYTTGETDTVYAPFTIVAGANYTFNVFDNATTPVAVAGAKVSVNSIDSITNATGQTVLFVAPGNHPYTVSKFGYEDATGILNVTDGVSAAVPVTLPLKSTFDVTFTVKNAINANINGAKVVIFNGANALDSGLTVAGVYTKTLPIGSYTYKVSAAGYVTKTAQALEVVNANVPVAVSLVEVIDPATGLTATVNGTNSTVTLNWFEPNHSFITPEWINNGGEGFVDNAVGTNGAAEFAVAHKFAPADLVNFDGGVISKIKFVPNEPTATYTLKVWQGTDANPTEVYSQAVSSITNAAWNEITLTTPVVIDVNQDLWIGYNVNTPTGYPAGCDGGPVVADGNMIYWEGAWGLLTDLAATLTYNWSIAGYVQAAPGKSSKGFLGTYNVYLGSTLKTSTPISAKTFTLNPSDFSNVTGSYIASVEAVYETGNSAKISKSFDWYNLVKNIENSNISIYPNPAKNMINVNATSNIVSVKVINVLGAQVISEKVDATKANINISNLESGMYYISVETANGVSTQKINVVK